MRVGLVIIGDINTLSGGYLYDRKLAEYLRQSGDDVEVISLKDTSFFKSLLSASIPVELRNSQFDIIVQDELAHPTCLRINKKVKLLQGCPVVSLVHLFNSSRPIPFYQKLFSSFLERLYLRTVDGLILNSKSTLEQARQLCKNHLPDHVVAVPCGDNFEFDMPELIPEKTKTLKILFVGNLSKQKCLHVLLEALDKLREEDIQLTIVGSDDKEPEYTRKLIQYIDKNRLHDKVEFKGPLIGEELRDIYLAHDFFVMPSMNEAYGIVYLEAMQFSLPVVATTSGGGKEIIRDGENGFLIKPGDVQTLMKRIMKLKNEPVLLAELSENARQSYLNHPVWLDTCSNIRSFLLKLSNKKDALNGQ